MGTLKYVAGNVVRIKARFFNLAKEDISTTEDDMTDHPDDFFVCVETVDTSKDPRITLTSWRKDQCAKDLSACSCRYKLYSKMDENKVGRVLKIDDINNNENTIKIRSKEELPKILSIITEGYVDSSPIINAIRRFVDSASKDAKKYNATYEILKKNYPKIKNIKEGENIIKDGDFLKESLKAVKDMNNSYLYFQGPPGVGKTYTAAFIIIELLKKGKKIGITAQKSEKSQRRFGNSQGEG